MSAALSVSSIPFSGPGQVDKVTSLELKLICFAGYCANLVFQKQCMNAEVDT